MSMYRRIGAAVLLSGIVTAAQAGTITRDDQYPLYSPSLVNYVAAKGSFPAVIVNNPFPGPDGGKALLHNLKLPGFFTSASFVETTPEARKDGHLVLLFDSAKAYPGSRAVCEAPQDFANAKPEGTLRLQAVFCYNKEPISEAYLTTPRPASPDDPGFRQSLAQLMSSLLPPRIPDGEQCQTPPNC